VTDVEIAGVRLIPAEPHADERGRLVEMVRASSHPEPFVQVNHSRSRRDVLRGLHYHRRQADLWYVVTGRARVGLADLRPRRDRPPVQTLVLDAESPAALYIPAGVAHGFVALTDLDLIYFVTREYDGTDEFGVAWDDPNLAVPWGIERPILSPRDIQNPELRWDQIPSFS
jgi:dTDP-4-dehydrorhamnose 3,5-epimerase